MATWHRVANGSTAGNISMNVDIGIQSVTRTSNSNVKVVYGVRFAMATSAYTYNSVAAFCPKDGGRYYAFKSGSGHTSSGTWYYANTSGGTTTGETCPFTINIPVSITQTSASFSVGYGWNGYTPAQKGSSSITVNFPTGATAPTGCWCSARAVSETQINLSGGYGSDGGASITGTGFQYSTDQNNWYGCSSTFYGSANTTYYFRYYASNSQGTSYSGNASATTYNYPYCTEAPNFTIGNNVTIKLYNPLNRTVKIQMWSHVSQRFVSDLITITGTSYTGFSDVTSRLYASIPNVKTSQYNIDVWYGDNKTTKWDGGNYSIRGDENPTFGVENIIDVVDTLNVAITGDNTKFIKGHNTLTGVITPMSSNYGANLDYYSVSASGLATVTKTYSTSNQSFILGNMVSNSFNVTAIDKRGMSRTAKIDIDLVAYNNPGVTIAKITRQNGIGTKAVLNFTGVYTDWTGLLKTNSIQSIRYRIGVNGTWKSLPSDATLTSSGGVWTLNAVLNDDFATTSQYDLYLEIKDLLETIVVGAYTISTADAFVWKDLANKRMGINKKPTEALDVHGNIKSDGNIEGINIKSDGNIEGINIKGNALYINGVKMIWYE